MNPMRNICMVLCLLAAVCATPTQRNSNALSNSLKPTEWLSVAQLENLQPMNEVTLKQLEKMTANEGAELLHRYYHLSQINNDIAPTYVPNANDVKVEIIKREGQNVNTNLNNLVDAIKQQKNFGNEEVTILITGLPQNVSPTVSKATEKLVQAYRQRYNVQQQQQWSRQQLQQLNNGKNQKSSSSEESLSGQQMQQQANYQQTGDLVIIDLGSAVNTMEKQVTLNTNKAGNMIGNELVRLTNEADVPNEIIHLVGQGVAAHVAGAAGRQYTRRTGHKIRRITALDPSRIFATERNTLSGLARGDAEFVDAIHSSAYGMGTVHRVGDVDFYTNGPSVAAPGTDNIVEATMRATRYFAESVLPGNERNFPAVAANNLKQYKNNNGHGKRAYMGIDVDYDVEGDYILQVNPKSPFGRSAAAQKQNTYHGVHQAWKEMKQQDNDY